MPEQNNRRSPRSPQKLDNTYAHLQPQALEIERAVLGALLIDKDAYPIVCELLTPESFYEPRNQMVYTAIRDLSISEKPVDVLTVTEQLAKDGKLEEAGGPAYIADISSRVASSAHVEYHAHIIAQKFLARQLIQYASFIETKAFDETINVAGPFPVRGHFRKQQKKDAAGQWYHDLIYIDTFMKNGYHRKATMEKLENYKEKLF